MFQEHTYDDIINNAKTMQMKSEINRSVGDIKMLLHEKDYFLIIHLRLSHTFEMIVPFFYI